MKTTTRSGAVTLAVAASLSMMPGVAMPQDGTSEVIEEIITTGTRREGQSPAETLSPIDVLDGNALFNQSTFDMTDGLTKIAPSLNTQRYPIADGTAFIRPVSLRNLSPDHTLVLVDGTRRHRSPLVNLQFAPLGTVNQGAQAVDYSALPALAIERIEVLRDGASAQYGSDAIAGVINVILKDDPSGFTVSAQGGEYYEGDGTRASIAANAGIGFANDGFLNLTAEYSTADITSRGVPHVACPAVEAVTGPGVVPLNGLCQRWGDPDVEVIKFFGNFGMNLTDNLELFANASFSDNDTISDFFYRTPVLDPSAMIGGRDTLIVDTNMDFIPDDAPQSLVDDITGQGLNPSDYLTADAGSPSGFVLLNPIASMFPGGYNPDFGASISDYAVVAGLRGGLGDDVVWDFRVRTSEAEADYTLSETINPSLGGLSPTSFKPGKLTQEETGVTLDFVWPIAMNAFASDLNLAFGLGWRDETYKIAAGDPASIEAGPAFIFGVASDGFQGFPVASAGSFSEDSLSAYVDVEADVTERLSLGAAVRVEDYDSFGNTFDFKVAARFQFTDAFALRGTVNTGFRAPTPGQINTLNTTTSADAQGNLIPSGTYPINHPVAQVLGATSLDPEESTSFTVGAVWQPLDNTSVTVDYYDIAIDDRLALLGPNTISQQNVDDLNAVGFPNADLLLGSLASHFANSFDSDVSGIDLAITSTFDFAGGALLLDLRHNFNQQEVSNVIANTINASRVFDLENQLPEHRTTITADYRSGGMLGGFIRLNNYGDWKSTGGLFSPGDASDVSSYSGALLVDAEVSLTFAEHFTVAVGAENLFDEVPDNEGDEILNVFGVSKAITSPYGFNGGFYYARAMVDF